jgi:uncharacterized protein (DUF1800 family)
MSARFLTATTSRRLWLALFLLGTGARTLPAQMIDLNGNGMSDVWEWIFGANNLSPNGDADGDGASNLQEAIAGTNPFDPNSTPRIPSFASTATNFTVNLSAVLGKQYVLQSCQLLTNGAWSAWTNEASMVARPGGGSSLSAATGPAAKLFRVVISDVDTDGDGVNDAEEYALGLDPLRPSSNGQLDANGQPMGDYAYAVSRLANQNVFTIVATDPTANQPDPGAPAVNQGVFTVTRGGFPLNTVTNYLGVPPAAPGLGTEGVDFSYSVPSHTLIFNAGVSSQTITVTPLANTNQTAPVLATLQLLPGPGYTLGAQNTNASVLVYPTATAAGAGLYGQYYTNSSTTYSSSNNFNPAKLILSRADPTVDFVWGNTTNPIPNNGYYCVRWTGQVQPQYSETYYFVARTDDGCRLWVNDQLLVDAWTNKSVSDITASIPLQAGVRYNLKLDYFQTTGSAEAHLSWYSPSQSKQIIPATRLYPSTLAPAPSQITSALSAVAFLNQPFTFTVTGANTPGALTATGLPPGLSFNPATGIISGTPTNAGDFQVTLTSSNAAGLGASVLDIQVLNTGSSVVQEIWLGVPGTNVSDIPVNLPATQTNALISLEGATNFGVNYGERVRGYFTAPATANYYFWIAGSDAAELWISNDQEPGNKVRRAYAYGTAPRQWNLQPAQRSGWLSLVAGQQYYMEILHKAGVGTNDNWSVGWLQDATGTNTVPAGIAPAYLLGRYYPLPVALQAGTLYSATLLPQSGAASSGVGSATLRLSADNSQAVLKFSYSGLTSPVTGEHIHSDPYLANPSQIMFDIDAATPQPDGSYVWQIGPVGTLATADVLEIIKEGKAYLNIHTTQNPNGEINGHFTLANGTQVFTPPPAPPAWTDDHASSNAAARFLIQATFGPSPADVAAVQSLGYDGWLSNQFSLFPTYHLPVVLASISADPTTPYTSANTYNAWWRQSITAPDQLRQRVAFALSEIMVISQNGVLLNNATALSDYYDVLLDNAFGNFRSLLKAVTLEPAMGLYLDMRANDVGSIITGLHANENYAREIEQLFSIGLNRMWPDGTLVLNSQGTIVPTYDQNVIMGFASVFTGWNYWQPNQTNGRLPTVWTPAANYTNPMVLVPTHHELGTKRLLDNVILPQAWGSQADPTSTNFDNYCSHDLEAAMDSIFNNQNVGPFICRQLIQRLVASAPSRDYLYRVVQVFNDDGSPSHTRGNLQAVIRAILLDYEARSSTAAASTTAGKQREPLLRATAVARAFPPASAFGGTYSQNGAATIAVACTNAHRLNNGDVVQLAFTDASSPTPQPAPPAQSYGVTVTSPTSFNLSAPYLVTGAYSQSSNLIYCSGFSSHGLAVGWPVYLAFTSGTATNGVYTVASTTNSSSFTVSTGSTNVTSGNAALPKITGGGYVVSQRTNVTFSLPVAHGLNIGDSVYVHFNAAGSPVDGQYTVQAVPDATHFLIWVPTASNNTQNNQTIYPLVQPVLVRNGTAGVQLSTWNMGATDTGGTYNLGQSPLNSPTVFNFYFPDFKFPGALASAGLTTPEFQLTSDTSVALQMNFLESGILGGYSNNTNGIMSFVAHGGAVVMDLGPYMTTGYTSNSVAVGVLFDTLNSLLAGGQAPSAARSQVVSYVSNLANFPYSAPPTLGQIRDRVNATVHMIISSPDFTVQK